MKQFIVQKMAVKNLTRRPVRSWSMIFFVFMLSFSLMLSTVLVDSMKDRLEKTTDRLGADIIVVPKEYERSMADSGQQAKLRLLLPAFHRRYKPNGR